MTSVSAAPWTAAVNACVPPAARVAEVGETEMVIVGCIIARFAALPLHASITAIDRMVRARGAGLSEDK
jgi:hypothetical protein